jgi:amino acid transporter
MVALSFLVLRSKEPELQRPYKVHMGNAIGIAALVLSIGLGILYLPGSPSALLWPQEWAILIGWSVLGLLLFAIARSRVRKQHRE